MQLEAKIKSVLLQTGSAPWRKQEYCSSPETLVQDLLAYLEGGANNYSTFWTYRRSYLIYSLVKEDLTLALLSPDPFIRSLATTIQKESVDIPPPLSDT